jgi:hypothetical protein
MDTFARLLAGSRADDKFALYQSEASGQKSGLTDCWIVLK